MITIKKMPIRINKLRLNFNIVNDKAHWISRNNVK